VLILDKSEEQILKSKIPTIEKSGSGQHPKYGVKACIEKRLCLLATILKSPKAK